MKKTIQGFETWLYAKGRDPESISRTLLTLKRIQNRYNDLTLKTFELYISSLYKARNKPNYINREISEIRLWGVYIGKDIQLPFAKTQETVKCIMTDTEIEQFLNLPRLPKAPRSTYETFTLFWLILSQTGMRPKELATLKAENLRDDGVFLYHTKTNKPRFVPLIPETSKKLQEFAKNKSGYIFTNKKGNRLDKGNWSREFRQRIRIMEIKREGLTAYSLRHSKITRMLEDDNISIVKIRKIVGHANIQSTLNYEHLTTKDVILANQKDRLFNKNLDVDTKSSMVIEGLRQYIGKKDSYEVKKTDTGVVINIKWG